MVINVDTLALVHKQTLVTDLYEILVESCNRYLRLLEAKVFRVFSGTNEGENVVLKFEAFHFYPETCGHFITRIFAKNVTGK